MGNMNARPRDPTLPVGTRTAKVSGSGDLSLHTERKETSPSAQAQFHPKHTQAGCWQDVQVWTETVQAQISNPLKPEQNKPPKDKKIWPQIHAGLLLSRGSAQRHSGLWSPYVPIPWAQPHGAEKCPFPAGQKGELNLCSPHTWETISSSACKHPLAQHRHFQQPLCLFGSDIPPTLGNEKRWYSVFPFALPALVEYWSYSPSHRHWPSPFPSSETPLWLETAFKSRFRTNNSIVPESTAQSIFLSSANSCKKNATS